MKGLSIVHIWSIARVVRVIGAGIIGKAEITGTSYLVTSFRNAHYLRKIRST
jgi:hypothetical protein